MDFLTSMVSIPLGYIMKICYQTLGNYGLSIIAFTLITKIIMLPIGIWVHKNSIKIIRVQPEINVMKIKFFGDADKIADEQAKIFKRVKYSPLASLIPLFVQIFLLMGLVNVIYHPLEYLFEIPHELSVSFISMMRDISGTDISASSIQLSIIELIRNAKQTDSLIRLANQLSSPDMQQILFSASGFDTNFLGIDIGWVPSRMRDIALLSPALAGFSSFVLCLFQNRINVLQSEQGKFNKYSTMALSVGLSLYLGWYVPFGVALYWISSNFFTIIQLLILNRIINPKKYVDYKALSKSKQELARLKSLSGKHTPFSNGEQSKREKVDYKRFFSIANKHLVFYSEQSGFYKYFENIIEELIKRSNVTIHYVTSDPDDAIFEKAKQQKRIKAYYISEKRLITLMLKMDADMVVMTMSDLGNFHIKRSYVRKDVEYVYLFHYPLSTHMVLHTGALDHYDTILCVGEFQFDEIRKTEEIYDLPPKRLVSCGYGQLEKLYAGYVEIEKVDSLRKKILIAPSWQSDNILDSCIDELLEHLLGKGFDIVVRPHPEYVKRYGSRMDAILARYANYEGGDLCFELDFTSNASIFSSAIIITDWSGTAYEFSFVTCKPAIFIDTAPKINNPEYVKLGIEPLEFALRDKIGIRISPNALKEVFERTSSLLNNCDQYKQEIRKIREEYIANFGHSGEVGARYILNNLKAHASSKQQ